MHKRILDLQTELAQVTEMYNHEWHVAERLTTENNQLINKGNRLLDKYFHQVQELKEEVLEKEAQLTILSQEIQKLTQRIQEQDNQLMEYHQIGKEWFDELNVNASFTQQDINDIYGPLTPASEKLFKELTTEVEESIIE